MLQRVSLLLLSSATLSDTQVAVPEVKVWAAVEPFCCWLFFTLVINLVREEVCFFRVWTTHKEQKPIVRLRQLLSSASSNQLLNYNFMLTDTISAFFVWRFLQRTTRITVTLFYTAGPIMSGPETKESARCLLRFTFFPFFEEQINEKDQEEVIKRKWMCAWGEHSRRCRHTKRRSHTRKTQWL